MLSAQRGVSISVAVWLCLSVPNYPQENTSFSLSHMTSSGGTEHSYLRVYRTNITNHLPEGVLESSLVQAGSLESEQPPFLQRTLGGETPGPRFLRRPEPCREKERRGWGNPAFSRRWGHGKVILLRFLLGVTVRGISKSPLWLL